MRERREKKRGKKLFLSFSPRSLSLSLLALSLFLTNTLATPSCCLVCVCISFCCIELNSLILSLSLLFHPAAPQNQKRRKTIFRVSKTNKDKKTIRLSLSPLAPPRVSRRGEARLLLSFPPKKGKEKLYFISLSPPL